MLIPISNARARLSELVRLSSDEDVVLTHRSAPAAVMVSADRYDALLKSKSSKIGSACTSARASQSHSTISPPNSA